MGQRIEAAQERIALLQQSVEEGGRTREELSGELTRIKVELASWEEKEKGEKNNLSRLEESQQEYIEARSSRLSRLKEAEKGRGEIGQGEEERERNLKELFEERDSFEEDIRKLNEDRESILSRVSELEKKVRDDRSKRDEIQERINGLEVRQARLRMEMDNIRKRISSEYQVSLDELEERKVGELDEEVTAQEIANLKARLEVMGPVNLVAIEENKELEERYNFLTNQQEDLLQAKESLQKVIAKINRTTRSQFMDTFTRVRGHFNELFRTLFGGGRAELVLIDEADVLESGIDIVAQPPGKKLQTISLLSGGERALTAIALLFALFKVKPSPFCLLDEIDAPLDESNIDRFIRLLQEFIGNSQFIIVTHNKRTIAMANVMYGVTMEESGV
ncbi:chromosome segregation protein SMC, partial [bacterium]|nr:chromosome segregation protein SMC [bacterium]